MNKVIQRALEIVGSQKRLADICGVSQPAVHKWLNGGSVSPEKVTAIVNATGIQKKNLGLARHGLQCMVWTSERFSNRSKIQARFGGFFTTKFPTSPSTYQSAYSSRLISAHER